MSVLVTAYQHERYVARALDSVLEQDGGVSFEILVGDDASTDATRAIIEEYAEAHPHRIRVVFPERNLGLDGKALLNELLRRARGEYVAMLDGDDHWTSPVKLRRQVAYLDEHPGCSMCFHDVLWRHEDGSRPDVRYNGGERPTDVTLDELVAGNPVASCSPVFRRSTIDPLPAWFFEQPWGDWQLYIIAAKHGTIHYLPEVMGVHITHAEGMWSRLSPLEGLEGITRCQEGMAGFVPPELERRRRQALAETWVKRAAAHARLNERAAARRCLRESFRVRPFEPRRRRRGGGERRRVALLLRLNVAEALSRNRALLGGLQGGDPSADSR
ncbi:MAG: glycosyltransferase, partial [Actinobacteria bacterium]|nr:glycosyltransferase [Actinomycetota bacterium]